VDERRACLRKQMRFVPGFINCEDEMAAFLTELVLSPRKTLLAGINRPLCRTSRKSIEASGPTNASGWRLAI